MSILWLSREDVQKAGGSNVEKAALLIESALLTHATGNSCQPLKPYLRIPHDKKHRRIIAMPAYLGGNFQTWGLKWIASSPENPEKRGIERASAVIIINDLESGRPLVIMEGGLISATRTVAVAKIAAKYLAPSRSCTLTTIGNGMIGSLITHDLLKTHSSLKYVKLYDQLPSNAQKLKASLEKNYQVTCKVSDTPKAAISNTDLLVLATTTQDGYIEGNWFNKGCLILNISLRDLKFSVVERANKLIVDDWEQSNHGNTVIHKMTTTGQLNRGDIYAELPDIIARKVTGRENDDEIILFNPMGLSIEDIATAWGVYTEAKHLGLGVKLNF